MMASVESLAALKRGDAKGASTAHLADDARWGVVAAHAEELARAVNASETIDRTERTIDAANVVLGLHRWLDRAHHHGARATAVSRRRSVVARVGKRGAARGFQSALRVPHAVSSRLELGATRRRNPNQASPGNVLGSSRTPASSRAPQALRRRARRRRRRSDAEVSPRASPFAAGDAAAAADEAYGGVDHDHGAVDDATLAAAMGVRPWARARLAAREVAASRIDQCLALALAPLCLRGVSADGDDDGFRPEGVPPLGTRRLRVIRRRARSRERPVVRAVASRRPAAARPAHAPGEVGASRPPRRRCRARGSARG